jgi:hypothetical protein
MLMIELDGYPSKLELIRAMIRAMIRTVMKIKQSNRREWKILKKIKQ